MKDRCQLSIIQLMIIFSFGRLYGTAAFQGTHAELANSTELHFVASLAYDNNKQDPAQNHFCTGTLIADKLILTANSCALRCAKLNCVIRIGSHDLRNCATYHLQSWKPFEIWAIKNRVSINLATDDLAVIELNESVHNIQPALLRANGKFSMQKMFVAGWDLENDARKFNLQKLPLRALTHKECETRSKQYQQFANVDTLRVICTKALDMRTSYAKLTDVDKGGPLYDEEYKVVGINLGSSTKNSNTRFASGLNLHCSVSFYERFLLSFSLRR